MSYNEESHKNQHVNQKESAPTNSRAMNAASGVRVSADLRAAFDAAEENNTRYIRIVIDKDALCVAQVAEKLNTFERDFASLQMTLDRETPCFFLFWKDEATLRHVFTGKQTPTMPSKLMVVLYSPESCTVRQKMIYASSRPELRALAGANADEYHATAPSDFSIKVYKELRKEDAALLSQVEQGLRQKPSDNRKASGFSLLALAGNP